MYETNSSPTASWARFIKFDTRGACSHHPVKKWVVLSWAVQPEITSWFSHRFALTLRSCVFRLHTHIYIYNIQYTYTGTMDISNNGHNTLWKCICFKPDVNRIKGCLFLCPLWGMEEWKKEKKKKERGKNTITVNIKINSAVKLCNRHENTQRKV